MRSDFDFDCMDAGFLESPISSCPSIARLSLFTGVFGTNMNVSFLNGQRHVKSFGVKRLRVIRSVTDEAKLSLGLKVGVY